MLHDSHFILGDGLEYIRHKVKVDWEENVKEALLQKYRRAVHCVTFVSSLHDRRVITGSPARKTVKVGDDQL